MASPGPNELTHWGRVMRICVRKLIFIGLDNGLSPGRRQAIIWTNVEILLIGTLGRSFNEILSEIHTFSFNKTHLKTSSVKWHPFYLGLNVLRHICRHLVQFATLMARCLLCLLPFYVIPSGSIAWCMDTFTTSTWIKLPPCSLYRA